jgi:hypothetical protein
MRSAYLKRSESFILMLDIHISTSVDEHPHRSGKVLLCTDMQRCRTEGINLIQIHTLRVKKLKSPWQSFTRMTIPKERVKR